jgi:hypothetical protein
LILSCLIEQSDASSRVVVQDLTELLQDPLVVLEWDRWEGIDLDASVRSSTTVCPEPVSEAKLYPGP